MRIDPQYSLMLQTPSGIYNLTLVMIVFITMSCNRHNLEDFNPDRIPLISTERLEELSDTTFVKGQLATLSAGQQIDSLIYYAEWLKGIDDATSIWCAQNAFDLSTEKNWNFPRAISAYRIASLRGQKALFGEDIELAMVDAKIAERLFKDFDRPDWELRVNSLLGQLEMRKGNRQVAQNRLIISLDQLKTINTWDSTQIQEQKAFLLHDLAFTYWDTLTIYQYFKESDSLYQSTGNQEDRARLWSDWANYLTYYENFPKSDSLLNLCLEYYAENTEYNFLSSVYRDLAYLYNQKFKATSDTSTFNKAKEYISKSLEIGKDKSYYKFEIFANLFHNIWLIQEQSYQLDSAIYYYQLSINEAKKEGAIQAMKEPSKNLASLTEYKNGVFFPDAKSEDRIYSFINDSYISAVDTITEHSKLAFSRLNKSEQRDIQVQANQKRQSQFYIALAILGLAGLIFLLIVQGQKNRRIQAEMDALRAQINPHFISNSLNAIESLVNFGDTKAAAKYLVHFSRLSRQILNGSRASMVSLAEELKTLKHFLALEQLRFRDKLTFDIKVIDDIPSEIVQVPAMILQPYAENAIWHGIKPKAEGGHVQISVRKIDKMLVCMVEDNGIGREQSRAMRKASVLKHKSMGMQITEERLKNLGKIKGSHVEIVDLKTENGEAKGTKVIIRFPYQTKKI